MWKFGAWVSVGGILAASLSSISLSSVALASIRRSGDFSFHAGSNACNKGAHIPALEPRPVPETGSGDPELDLSKGGRGWHITAIQADKAWELTRGNPDVSIAIVDSGVEYNHPDLAANLKHIPAQKSSTVDETVGWDFDRESALPWDNNGHGTFMAGLAAATGDNGIGSSGVCPRCSLLAYRFMNADGLGDDADAARGIRRAVNDGARIINASFAGEGSDDGIREAIKFAAAHDVVVVVAAGNDSDDVAKDDVYPAKWEYPNMIKVAAATQTNHLAKRSNYSTRYVQVASPGRFLVSTWTKGSIDIDDQDGGSTSIATPVVSGTAGLMLSANPALTAAQVVQILENTVTYSPALEGKVRSSGVINALAAVRCAKTLACLKK